LWNKKHKRRGVIEMREKIRQTNTTITIKNNSTKMASIHMTTLRKMKRKKNKTETVEYGSHKMKKSM